MTTKTIIGKAPKRLSSRDDVDQSLLAIGQAEMRLDVLKAELDAEINAVKARYEPEAKSLDAEITKHKNLISEWAGSNRAEFGGKQSLKLVFGKVIFRKSTGYEFTEDEPAVIANIKSQLGSGGKWREFIRSAESVIKSALGKIPADKLPALGIKRDERETVGYQTDRVKIEEAVSNRLPGT